MKKILITLLAFVSCQLTIAQNFKFGKVSKEELAETYYELDSTANAVFLLNSRKSYYAFNAEGLTLLTDYHVRIKIYNKEGVDWATKKEILHNTSKDEEILMNFKAATYNLVDGDIEVTKMSKKELFKEKVSDYRKAVKFTMPNVQDGSVIEYRYKVSSPFYWSVDDIVGQFEIPVKKLQVSVGLLEYFKFSTKSKGHYHLNIQTSNKRNVALDTNDALITIDQNNIPAIQSEAYVNNIDNYKAGLAFEVRQFIIPGKVYENFSTSWDDVAKNIYKSSNFGGELDKTRFIKEEIAVLKASLNTEGEKILGAFDYVKSKIKWDGYNNKYSKGIREAVKEGSGNAADINLLLVSVLRELGLKSNPVLVSTRSNGIVLFPSSDGFNYVTAAVETEKGVLVLDATEKYGVPGVLPLRVLNGRGRLVREDGTSKWVSLSNAAPSKTISNLSLSIKADGLVEGISRTQFANYAAMDYREDNLNVNEDEYITSLEAKYNDILISDFRIQNKTEKFKPVIEMFKFEGEDLVEEIGNQFVIKPLLFKAIDENPFKLDERLYPVDFGTPFEIKNTVSITIPEGYEIVSVPETVAIGLPDDLGVFKFVTQQQGNSVTVLSQIQINTSVYPAAKYQFLKDFYSTIVSKCAENVVIRKGELLK